MNPEIYNGGGGWWSTSEKTIIFLQGKLNYTSRILCELFERKEFLCCKKERNPLLDLPNGVGSPAPMPLVSTPGYKFTSSVPQAYLQYARILYLNFYS